MEAREVKAIDGRLVSGSQRLDSALNGEGRDGVENREGRTSFAGRREPGNAYLIVRKLELRAILRGKHLGVAQARISVPDGGFEHRAAHRTVHNRGPFP